MKKSLIYLALSVFLTISAVTAVIVFAQWPYIALIGWGFAAASALFLYNGLREVHCRFIQEYGKKQETEQQQQKLLIQALTELRSASDKQSALLLQEQKNISASVKTIINELGTTSSYLERIQNELIDPNHPENHLIALLSDSFQKLPSRIAEAEKDQLSQIKESFDAQHNSVTIKLSSIIEDIETTADYLDQIHNMLVDPEHPEIHLIPLLSDSFQRLPSRIFGAGKEQLHQLKESMNSVNTQLIALEESLFTYMGNYQTYLERFSQLSQQDIQILNNFMENDNVQ